MPPAERPTAVIFAKAPVLGAVKTRLAAAIGDAAALDFYERTLATLVQRLCADDRWRTCLAVTPDDAVADPGFAAFPAERAPQGEGDLGDRMARQLAAARPGAPVVIVGSDIPALEARHVAAAFDALTAADLVLGPAPDGGYWLIGCSRPPPPGLFEGVRWSTPHARADTLGNAAGLGVTLLETLEDVDDEASWRRHCNATTTGSGTFSPLVPPIDGGHT